jgi:hypothetical protein
MTDIDDPNEVLAILEASSHTTIFICQGPPRCDFDGDEAVAAQKADCPFCKRILIDEDMNETIVEPGTA